MSRIEVKYPGTYSNGSNGMYGSFGEAFDNDSIFTSGLSDCVAVVLFSPKHISLYHIGGGCVTSNYHQSGIKKLWDHLLSSDQKKDDVKMIICYGTNSSSEYAKQSFKNQDLIRSLIQRIKPCYIYEFSGSNIEVFSDLKIAIDGVSKITL